MELQALAQAIRNAGERIRPHILTTPLISPPVFREETGVSCYLKLENRQHTGSFKARGAINKLLSIAALPERKSIVTASTGNHGLGVARALGITGLDGTIYVPENASPLKLKALHRTSARVVMEGKDSLETELIAKDVAKRSDAVWVSPYNDYEIIAGQGTLGMEMITQVPDVSAVYVTVGGGGLISGVGAWYAMHSPDTEVIGCLPENSPEMKLSVDAGRIIHLDSSMPTLSDGSAGGLEDGSLTFSICQKIIHKFCLVSEDEIASAIRDVYRTTNERIEGSAGVAIAAMRKDSGRFAGRNVVAIVCGGNIDDSIFDGIVGD